MSTNNVDDTSVDQTTEPDSAASAQDTAPVADNSTVQPGYAKAKASGAVKFTDVVPGGQYNGIVVPDNATSTDGNKFYDKTGSALVDNPHDADGEPNMLSSAYISEWAQNALKKGVNPIIINDFIKPWADLATQTKEFEMKNSDNILMKQGLDQDNKTKAMDLGNKYAETIGTSAPAVGIGLISQLRAAKPQGAPDSPVLMQFGVQPTDTPAQAYAKIKQSGPAQQALASLQSTQTGIAATQQGMTAQKFETGQQAVGSLEAGQNAVTQGAIQANKAQTAVQLFNDLKDKGKIGGTWQDMMNRFDALISQNDPDSAKIQELKSYMSLDNLSSIKQAFGQRIAASEYNSISPSGINPKWQTNAIGDFLNNNAKYAKLDSNTKKTVQSGIINNVDKLGFGVDTSPYKNQLKNADESTKTVIQKPQETPLHSVINVRGKTYVKMKDGPDNDQNNWQEQNN